jgi:hypothetical protein
MQLKLRKPLICRPFPMACASGGIAGVGTFPGWLNLAVAPTSKGLIPRSVSMSRRSVLRGSRTRQGARGDLERRSRGDFVCLVIGLRAR